jgi:hypothetical protein
MANKNFDPSNNPDWKEFEKRVRKELIPKIEEISLFVSITPSSENVDVKFAVELGVAIMLDKPIIAVIKPGSKIPEKLAKKVMSIKTVI